MAGNFALSEPLSAAKLRADEDIRPYGIAHFACSRRAASLRLGLVSAADGRPPSPTLQSIRAAHDGSDA